MADYILITLARIFHVLGVVFWIGGVAFVTSVLLHSLKQYRSGQERMETFERLENRFAFQAKISTLVTGISGFYMVYKLDIWHRFADIQFWWMHLMVFIWLVFTLILFVLEPLFLHEWFKKQAERNGDLTFRRIHRMHYVLLSLSLLTIIGAVAGSHGLYFL